MYCYYIKNIIIIYMDNEIEESKNKEDEPKISKKEKKNILKILKRAVFIVLVVFIFLFLNANIIFNIKVATKAILNISFPSECDQLPYGTENVNPCIDGLDWAQKATKKLMCLMKGGDKQENSGKCQDPRSLPYRWFKKNTENIFDDYLNWFIGSLTHTQISLHSGIKNVLEWLKEQPAATPTVLIILSFILLTLSLIIIFIYVFCSLIFNQITSLWKHEALTAILIFFTGIFVFFVDYIIAFIDVMKIFFELAIRPIFNKEKRQYILNIVRDQRIIVGYIFGFAFLKILDSIPMNKHYEKPVKIIPAIILYSMIIIHFIKWIYGIITNVGGSTTTNKCKK